MGKPPTGSATAAFYIRLLVEGLQSRSRGHRVLEAGFTGMRVDKLGHKRYYRDGRQVKNPSPEEKQSLASHGQQTAPSSGASHSAAGGAPSASKSLSNLGPHADPEQVRSVANDLMRLSVKDLSKLASQPAEQATSHGNQSGIGEAGDLVSLDTNQIHVDPKRFQYKQSLDASTGTGDHLKGVNKFNPLFAGVVHAWKDPADGKTYVVNGHHRMELARRAGHQKMNVQMIIAPNATTARATGALINMAEGRGTALDAAKFLRDSKQSIEDLKGHGVSLKEKVVDNAVQLRGLSDRIFNDLLTGRLEEDKAVAIGRHLKDHDAQEQLYNHYLEQRDKHNKEFSAATLEQAAMDVANAPKQQGGGQMDLFGNTDDGKSLFLEKAELKNKLRAALAQEVNDYTVAGNARRAKNIAGAGNVLQVEKNKELSKAADRIKQGFEQFQHLAGPLSDAINAHVEDYASASPKQKRTIVEKALADARGAIQAIISGGAENDLRAGAQDSQGDPSPGTTEPGTVSGDLRGGNAGDLGPSLFGPQDEPTPAAEKSAKPEEPGFTGIDAQGREWRNGELVAKQEEPKAASPGNGLDANALALDALRLKGNRKPHNAAHITVPALLELKEKGYINDAGQLTNDGRLYLYAQKGKPVRQATGPKAAKALVGPEAPAPERGSDAELAVLNALRLRANRKAHNSSLITPAAVASLQAQNLVDASGRITAQGRSYLTSQKAPVPAAPAPKTPSATSAPEKYFGTGGEHTVVVQNGKKLRIPAPLENVPGWTDYEPVAPKAFYNLDEQEVVEHREAQELVRREWPKFRQEYLTKMGTFDADGNLISITCNCDDWRDLFPTYKGTNSGSIHDAASYANMRMLNEAWALMKGKGNNQFLVLGGGGGSGKGTATKDIIQVTEYPVVLDSVSDDSAWTKELMDGAAKHGLDGQFVFIDRAPADAWKDGVVKRAMQAREKFDAGDPTSLARTVPLSVAVPANLKARRAALELFEEGKVPSIIINNNLGFGKAKQVDENAVAAYLQQGIGGYNKEELLKELENDTRGLYEQGKIPPDIAKGLLGARAIAGGRDQLRSTGASDSGRPATGRGADENPPGASDQAPLDERGRAPGDSGEQGSQGKSSSEPVAPAANQPGFTGTDAQGREWRNGELVAKQEEPAGTKPAADLFGNPLPDNKPKSPETMPGLFGEPVPIGADKPQSAPEPTTAGTDNPLDRPDAAKKDDTQDMFGLFGPVARQAQEEPATPEEKLIRWEKNNPKPQKPKPYGDNEPNRKEKNIELFGKYNQDLERWEKERIKAKQDLGLIEKEKLAAQQKRKDTLEKIISHLEFASQHEKSPLAALELKNRKQDLNKNSVIPDLSDTYYSWLPGATAYVESKLKAAGAKKIHTSDSGSSYWQLPNGKEIRLSDHHIPDNAERSNRALNGGEPKWQDNQIVLNNLMNQSSLDSQIEDATADQKEDSSSQPENSDEENLNPKYYEKSADIPQFVKDAGWDTVAKLKSRGISTNLIRRLENHADTIIRGVATYLDSPKAELEELKKRLVHQVAVAGGMDSALSNLQWQYERKSKENHWAPSTGPGLAKISRSIGELRDELKKSSSKPKNDLPENSPIQPSAPADEPKTSNKAPGISLSDVPYDLAYNAHRGTSHVPDTRARQRQQSYINQMQSDWEYLSKFAKTPEQEKTLRDEFARYKAGYLEKYKTALSAESRTLSPMIAGPARFPTGRNNKANDVADRRRQEVEDFRKKALFAASKAINPVASGAPVLSRDADAVQTLQTQLDQLVQSQELMKKMNAAYKKFLKNPDSLATSGLTEKQQAYIKDFQVNPPERAWSKVPFPPYKLQNQGANIRRIQDRIETLSKLKATPEKQEEYTGGVSVSHDPTDARIRVRFPGKPSPEVIKQIKSKGFIWSPTNGAWQRQLNNNGIYATDQLMQELGHEKLSQSPGAKPASPTSSPPAAENSEKQEQFRVYGSGANYKQGVDMLKNLGGKFNPETKTWTLPPESITDSVRSMFGLKEKEGEEYRSDGKSFGWSFTPHPLPEFLQKQQKEAVMPTDKAAKIALVQAIISQTGAKPPRPKQAQEAQCEEDPRVKRIRELLAAKRA